MKVILTGKEENTVLCKVNGLVYIKIPRESSRKATMFMDQETILLRCQFFPSIASVQSQQEF